MKANGWIKTLSPNPILGYTDTETVKLDMDTMPFNEVKYWARKTMGHYRLGGFIIFKSSRNSYHVLFNRPVSWMTNVGIVAWVCLRTKHRRLTEWLVMQCIKHASTLRVSMKNRKPAPRIVYRYGKQDKQIQRFLASRKQIKRIIRRIEAIN